MTDKERFEAFRQAPETFFPEFIYFETADRQVCPAHVVKWKGVYEQPKVALRTNTDPVLPKLVAVDLTLVTGEVVRVRGDEAETLNRWLSARTRRIKIG
jgi:hypothetical protein